jgi:hypothetical protein
MLKIAIVGPQEDKWTEELKVKAKMFIEQLLYEQLKINEVIVVSGHCPKGGVDIWAEDIAKKLGIDTDIFIPEVNQWDDRYPTEVENPYIPHKMLIGYKSRNMAIAKDCNILYCIVPNMNKFKVFNDTPMYYCKHCRQWGHPSNGGCWALKYCKDKLGKETKLVIIE